MDEFALIPGTPTVAGSLRQGSGLGGKKWQQIESRNRDKGEQQRRRNEYGK